MTEAQIWSGLMRFELNSGVLFGPYFRQREAKNPFAVYISVNGGIF